MKIGIKKDNGDLYFQHLTSDDQEKPLKCLGYDIINVDVEDIKIEDFNEDLTFNIEKYNSRKQKENIEKRINELKSLLAKTDYQSLKYSEGELTFEEFEPIRLQRKAWREEINKLGG